MAPFLVASRSLALLDGGLLLPVPPTRPQHPDRRQRWRTTVAVHSNGEFQTTRTLTISFSDLKDKDKDLSTKIEEGFGPDGLGIISISNVPGFPLLRENLLHLAPRIAKLPDDAKRDLEDPDSRFNFGWSHAKEEVESGKLDTSKGSFYANPILDIPTTDLRLLQRYPSYCRPNKWPRTSLPELEIAFKALGKLMLDVGMKLAYHCHKYVSKKMVVCEDESLEHILRRSRCHKGRLLYYFPSDSQLCDNSISSWCGWHTDHGSLTALYPSPCLDIGYSRGIDTFHNFISVREYLISPSHLIPSLVLPFAIKGLRSAIPSSSCQILSFMDIWFKVPNGSLTSKVLTKKAPCANAGLTCGMFTRNGVKIACPDSAAGLYVKTRNGEIVRVVFGENELAYQIGETTEILSKGHLCATPHCVQGPRGENAVGVDRSTFAMFMQPDWDEKLRFPGEIHHHPELIPPNGILAFGEFSEKLLGKYYRQL